MASARSRIWRDQTESCPIDVHSSQFEEQSTTSRSFLDFLAPTRLLCSLFILITVSIKVLSVVLRLDIGQSDKIFFQRNHLEVVHQLPLIRVALLWLSPFQEAAKQTFHSAAQIYQIPTNQACLPFEHWVRLAAVSVASPPSPQCWGGDKY